MFNVSPPLWDGSLEIVVKIRNSKSRKIATPVIGLIIETEVWPAEQRINYSSLMLYHNIINSSEDRLLEQTIQEQTAQNHSNNFYDKVRTIAEELNIELEKSSNNEEIRLEKNSQR